MTTGRGGTSSRPRNVRPPKEPSNFPIGKIIGFAVVLAVSAVLIGVIWNAVAGGNDTTQRASAQPKVRQNVVRSQPAPAQQSSRRVFVPQATPTPIPTPTSTPIPPLAVNMYRCQFYNNATWQGAPVGIQDITRLDYNWGPFRPGRTYEEKRQWGMSHDYYSVECKGNVEFQRGRYVFNIRTDDPTLSLTVNDAVIQVEFVNRRSGYKTYAGVASLDSGIHEILMRYTHREEDNAYV